MLFGRTEIEALIPHRYPVLMLDRVTECVPGRHGVAERELREDDIWFAGHFPDDPILPGALIVEACAQLVAVVCRAGNERVASFDGGPPLDYLAAVERFKFVSPVRPGQLLTIEAQVGRRIGGLVQSRVSARVGHRPVASGTLSGTSNVAALEDGVA